MSITTQSTVLIADDQQDVRAALRLLLKAEGMACVEADAPADALAALHRGRFACALIDLNYRRDTTSGEEGLALLEHLREQAPELPVVVMTAWGNVPLAVEAMRRGAADFIEKPWDNLRLLRIVQAQVALAASRQRGRKLEAENALLRGEHSDNDLVAEAPAMLRMLDMLARVAPSDANVLVLGENGSGKGVVANRIHALSARARQALVKVNMGGIHENVFESEMFGHVKGAFTDARAERIGRFELADGGTLFLDEVGNVPAAQQPKLLRVLEDRQFERLGSSHTQSVDVRLISATNADLSAAVAEGRFRQDLLYRLNTVELAIPPLRERREDILPLAHQFLARSAARYGRDGLRLSSRAENALLAWRWPGNVRELQHLMERAALLAEHAQLDTDALAFGTPAQSGPDLQDMTLEQAEARLVARALDRHGDNLQRAADALGITRQTLYRRMQKYDLRTAAGDAD